jgi:hypothetical protein
MKKTFSLQLNHSILTITRKKKTFFLSQFLDDDVVPFETTSFSFIR